MSIRTLSHRLPQLSRSFARSQRCASSSAAAVAATQSSNLPDDMKSSIQRAATLRTPDPAADSQAARLVASHTPYMVPTYVRPPPVFQRGAGCHLYDVDNRAYLDFTAGIAVNALGHCDPGVARILASQAETLLHCSNLYHNPWTGELARLLVDTTRSSGAMPDAAKVFVCNSGSEANEAALKFVRKAGKLADPSGNKTGIVSFQGSFHGRTMGALSATPNPKYQKPFAPMLPNFSYGTLNDISALDSLVTESTCGVIVEPIQGEGGINVASPSFLSALRKRCDAVGALLIFDEIQCGLGRTGDLWAHAASGVFPDILTTAKALGNGYPVGAALVTDAVSEKIVTGDHGTTFGGNPLACRVAHYMLSQLSSPQLLKEVKRKEGLFRGYFEQLRGEFGEDVVKEIRGRGLILGLQLSEKAAEVVTAARERGLLVITAGSETLRFVPPLVITDQEIGEGMGMLKEAMEVVFGRGDVSVKGTQGQQEMGMGSR